jgi:hypothetical protein
MLIAQEIQVNAQEEVTSPVIYQTNQPIIHAITKPENLKYHVLVKLYKFINHHPILQLIIHTQIAQISSLALSINVNFIFCIIR